MPIDGELYNVILSDGQGWRHLSASNAQKKRLPPWETMCRLRDLFFSDDEWVIQYHPPKDEYINDHPFVLHLWSSLNEPIPIPPPHLV